MNCRLEALGMINSLGNHTAEIGERLFSAPPPALTDFPLRASDGSVPVAAITSDLPPMPSGLSTYDCRNHRIAAAAFSQISDQVLAAVDRLGPKRVGVLIGSSTSGIDAAERAFFARAKGDEPPAGYSYDKQHAMGSVCELLATMSGAMGPAYTLSTACTSSAKVLLSARQLIEGGICDAVLTGGVDTLCRLAVNGFFALGALAKARTNPMSANRDGLNIGEGAALFLMTSKEGGTQLLGGGETTDAYHMSAPHPEGTGAEASMRAALADAGLEPDQIDYLNLHGTGTPPNDAMESKAVARIFEGVPASSTKPFVGHCLGAAGAMEVGFCHLALRSEDRTLPPHVFDGAGDPELPPLSLVARGDSIPSHRRGIMMSNSFAFGGNNCSVIIGAGGGQ